MIRFGYCCINMQLSKQGIRTGRTMIDRKFRQGGMQLASDISLANARDLLTILQWNEQQGIRLYRIGSEIFPRWNHYELADLPDIAEIAKHLRAAGDFARAHGHRLTTHPGPFHILGSPDPVVVENSIVGLERHSEMFDLMGYAPSFDNLINIHVGATYGDKLGTTQRWIQNWHRLSDNLKARLVLENDDKASMYSVRDLYELIHVDTAVPITFDYWHHTFNTGDLSEREAFFLRVRLGNVMVLLSVLITQNLVDANSNVLLKAFVPITAYLLKIFLSGLPLLRCTRSSARSKSRLMPIIF